ncbi:MAG: tetratricopeptide repeat protein [Candidatus Burarchaeum sp.]|nr:tetratricopeptide repeat protein [Candidatus Burarchaeum sp.]MDO8340261.1 tetratricopeptide repeat protein [Candidatus Burarchaeum sp.]
MPGKESGLPTESDWTRLKSVRPELSSEHMDALAELSAAYLRPEAAELTLDSPITTLESLYLLIKQQPKKISKKDSKRVEKLVKAVIQTQILQKTRQQAGHEPESVRINFGSNMGAGKRNDGAIIASTGDINHAITGNEITKSEYLEKAETYKLEGISELKAGSSASAVLPIFVKAEEFYEKAGALEKAIAMYVRLGTHAKVQANADQELDYCDRLAGCYAKLGDYLRAAEAYEPVLLRLNDGEHKKQFYVKIAENYEKAQVLERATRYYMLAADLTGELSPDNALLLKAADCHEKLGAHEEKSGNRDGASKHYLDAAFLAQRQNNADAQEHYIMMAAEVHAKNNDFESAGNVCFAEANFSSSSSQIQRLHALASSYYEKLEQPSAEICWRCAISKQHESVKEKYYRACLNLLNISSVLDQFTPAQRKDLRDTLLQPRGFKSLTMIAELEKQRPGAFKTLYDVQGIRHLGRYGLSTIISQYDRLGIPDPAGKPVMLVLFPWGDWNGSFYHSGRHIHEMEKYFDVRIVEAKTRYEAARRLINISNTCGKISTLLLGGHGTQMSVRLDNAHSDSAGKIIADQLVSGGDLSRYFIAHPSVIFVSCSAGAEGGIMYKTSFKYKNATFYASAVPSTIDEMNFVGLVDATPLFDIAWRQAAAGRELGLHAHPGT